MARNSIYSVLAFILPATSTTMLFWVMTLPSAIADTLPAGKPYPEFQIGVTGIHAEIKDGVLAVTRITPGTPAEGKLKAGDGPGYVTGGLLHAAGVQLLTTLILSRECGVDVDQGTYDRALTLFFRYAGHGTVPYGDHHPTMYWGDNGNKIRSSWGYLTHPEEEQMPVEWYAKLLRHYSPVVRSWAAHGLGYQGEPAVPEILKALKSSDARVRVAGMEAAAGTLFWGTGCTEVKITPEMIKEHFLPYIIKPLEDPNAPMWEKRHAMMTLARADKQTIAAHTSLIEPYFSNDEWYLRVAAFTAIQPLIEETELIRQYL